MPSLPRSPFAFLLALLSFLAAPPVAAEDGYDLWLRYKPLPAAEARGYLKAARRVVTGPQAGETIAIAREELARGIEGLLRRAPAGSTRLAGDGAIVIGTPKDSPEIAALDLPLDRAGAEGYVIRSVRIDGRRAIVIAANEEIGVLYGAFHLLRLMQTLQPLDALDIVERPGIERRLLNHWDNLDRTVERGYAGQSIWDWHKLPDYIDPRYRDYARANASIGINGTVLTNVNADAVALTPAYLEKTAALADVFRPYGVRVYLTARFSAPIEIGGLDTADPLDPRVRAWWRDKASEIYALIPDFGGFLVKANSEGQPGPQDYGRTHADGANMLAEALAPHGGVVMWRAFVYSAENPDDRAKQAYDEFVPLDGAFRDNVLVQVKNGPIDFQPREPFHPLFGAMSNTPLALELQITKEYLGFATHLVYLAPMWKETLDADTYAAGAGSTVAKVVDGSLHDYPHTAIAGVSNIGSDRNWTGSHFDQANWRAFGRLAWNPLLSPEAIAEEWVRMTFSNDERFVAPVVDMMLGSHEAAVDYMTPLGLHHLMGTGHHYGPAPWVDDLDRPEWNPVYYHRADREGVGFDRTETGSNALAQYAPEAAAAFAAPETTPEEYLLWFHRVSWDFEMKSGRTLWEELVHRYTRGVEKVAAMRRTWAGLDELIDAERHAQVAAFLAIQEKEAKWWRDACLAYFQAVSGLPFPEGYDPPARSLDYYKSLSFPYAPGH
ncbi:alpha-glucuronidase family glycosyl hydrolase [Amphiplicatus metriothermophilus]|uniref:Xylan alpha-1,2-glucuronidase n=1 Tax=Amphiplicatus metriothermophilus TaxID=1519374 RepID=A0A239PNV0_9PROT|nr:alpha-glucuronidase family glycosyl hydrolase [Amphiplicatus metriothermophilus]MBB5518866.1 alpha-glucuronidase [Amphiplicatus metriothermophilus]SNT71981.1 alpha-glucuronidase [Amphiplicatus metriothermophilus]